VKKGRYNTSFNGTESVITEWGRRGGGCGRLVDRETREPANRAGEAKKKRLTALVAGTGGAAWHSKVGKKEEKKTGGQARHRLAAKLIFTECAPRTVTNRIGNEGRRLLQSGVLAGWTGRAARSALPRAGHPAHCRARARRSGVQIPGTHWRLARYIISQFRAFNSGWLADIVQRNWTLRGC